MNFSPEHFLMDLRGRVAVITLNRPERKNPLTFDSYAELRDTFRTLDREAGPRAVVIHGAGGNFCSGGDVHEIIGPLLEMDGTNLLNFTRMTGDLVKAMRSCPCPSSPPSMAFAPGPVRRSPWPPISGSARRAAGPLSFSPA